MNWSEQTRLVVAIALVALYACMCAAIWLARRSRQRQAARDAAAHFTPGSTQSWLIAYASQTGFAEQLAHKTAQIMHTAGASARVAMLSEVSADDLQQGDRALFIVSTYGEGDPPDNASLFADKLMGSDKPQLAHLHFGMLMLGDRHYTHFCGFGLNLTTWLKARGAQPLFDNIAVDSGGDHVMQSLHEWQHHLSHIAGTNDAPDWEGPAYQTWTLAARQLLNPGSAGNGTYHLELQAPTNQTATWEAGDLVQILAPADPQRPRDYSIASIPSDGRMHLLVRQERHEDGALGVASGWLTHEAPLGAVINLRLRAHANFRIGGNLHRPLILIGNGSGLAGLRSHLKARAANGQHRNWLIFGERNAEHDFYYREEIMAWQASGVLERTDIVFSRDGDKREYVQDRLLASASEIAVWLQQGAALYVCGSLQGMAGGVEAALTHIVGEAGVRQLIEDGRYRRDVY